MNRTESPISDSSFSSVKFNKTKAIVSVDWNNINRKLARQTTKEQIIDRNDLFYSMYDENENSNNKRENYTLKPSSINKLKTIVKKKREYKKDLEKNSVNNEICKEFNEINEILEGRINYKEKELEKILRSDINQRQK